MNILIIGATSEIAISLAKEYAMKGHNLVLVARSASELKPVSTDISIRYDVSCETYELDVLNYKCHENMVLIYADKIDGIVYCAGYLGDQRVSEKDSNEALKTINTNLTAAVLLLNHFANNFENRGTGFIIGISSVAGDRGRATNYLYGAAKAGFTTYLSGLRNRLYKNGVHVLTVKPGFVFTKMTAGMSLPGLLTARPEQVAQKILTAQFKKKNIIYIKPVWRYIMLVIKYLPEGLFKRLNI